MADLITSFSDAELHDLEDKAEAAMAAALDAVMEIIASRIERNARPITSAAGDEPAKEPGQPYVSPDDLASIGPLWDEQVQQRLMPMVAQVYQDSAGQIHASLVDAADLPDLPAASSLAAETYLAGVQNVYRNVGTDLWSTARTELQEGFRQGESIDELAARVRGAGKISARNAELVARSTVIEASNAGSIATARAAGLDMQKEWINTHDARTRPTHQDEALGGVGGQRVDLNAQFTVGGFSADAPGDPTLPPQEKYRCRCTVGYVMGKRDVAHAHTEAHQQAEQQALPNTAPSAVESIGQQGLADVAPTIAPASVEAAQSAAESTSAERVSAIMTDFRPVPLRGRQAQIRYFDDNTPKLTRAQTDALQRYSEQNFADFNAALRAGDTARNAQQLRDLDSAMRPLPDDLLLVRVVDTPAAFGLTSFDELPGLTGRSVIDRAPMSTSLDRQYQPLAQIRMTIAAPKGTPAALMRSVSSNPEEMEVLLGRDLELTITRVTPGRFGGYNVSAVVTPRAARATTQTAAEQVTAERRARRQAARARSAEIEAAKPYADLAAEIDQNVAAAGGRWTPTLTKVLQQRVDSARIHGVSAESVDRIERAIRNQNFADLEDVTARMASNVGLRSFGIRGERMAFDPDTMEAIGEAGFEPGQMVQVFRQGHVLTLADGTTVQISRAVVRTPPVGRTRPLSGIMDHLWPRSWQGKASDDAFEQAKGDLASAFEGRFGDLVARVDAVHEPDRLDHPDGFMINGSILNADGEQVGIFTRVLYRATGDHPSYVANAYLRIDSSAQGSGFASQFNKTMFDWYRQAGIDHVEVHANIDVGGYTWAAQGFDFANPSAAAAWRESMRETLAQYDGQPETLASELGLSVDDARGQITDFRQMLGAQQAGQSVSAYAFSQVGRKKGQGKNDLWIGKFLMLGSGWDGVLPL